MRGSPVHPYTSGSAERHKSRAATHLAITLWLFVIYSGIVLGQTTAPLTGKAVASFSGYTFNRTTNTYDTLATITNQSIDTITAPVQLVITNISNSTISLANAAGVTSGGQHYVDVAIPASGLVPAGRVTNVLLKFKNPAQQAINFTYAILGVIVPELSLTIASPTNGASLATDSVLVKGTFNGPINTGITANGVIAAINGSQFFATIPLQFGGNTILVRASTIERRQLDRSITVISGGTRAFSVQVAPQTGIAPLPVTFTIQSRSATAIKKIEVDFDGNGVMDFTTQRIDAPLTFTYPLAGVFSAKFAVTDILNRIDVETMTIVVGQVTLIDQKFRAVWSELQGALVTRDTTKVANLLTLRAQNKFKPVFEKLSTNLPSITKKFSALQRVAIGETYAEYAINKVVNGKNQIFFIYFLQSSDGVWRIDEM